MNFINIDHIFNQPCLLMHTCTAATGPYAGSTSRIGVTTQRSGVVTVVLPPRGVVLLQWCYHLEEWCCYSGVTTQRSGVVTVVLPPWGVVLIHKGVVLPPGGGVLLKCLPSGGGVLRNSRIVTSCRSGSSKISQDTKLQLSLEVKVIGLPNPEGSEKTVPHIELIILNQILIRIKMISWRKNLLW